MRRALIDFAADTFFGPKQPGEWLDSGLAPAIEAMAIANVRIVGSAPSPNYQDMVVRLVAEGDGLPEQCEQGWLLVRPTFQQEMHGGQRIIKLLSIEIVGKPNLIVAA